MPLVPDTGRSFFKTLVVTAALCLASIGAYYLTPTKMMADAKPPLNYETAIPATFGDWKIDSSMPVVVPDPSQYELINRIYSQTLSRTYVNKNGERVMLSLAYGRDQSDTLQIHTPEVCYPAQGFKVTRSKPAEVTLAGKAQPVLQLVATAGQRVEPITYWVVVGDYVANDGGRARRNVRFIYGMQGWIPDGVFFRLSSIGGDVDRQYQVQQKFLSALFENLSPDSRNRLAGTKIY